MVEQESRTRFTSGAVFSKVLSRSKQAGRVLGVDSMSEPGTWAMQSTRADVDSCSLEHSGRRVEFW